MYGRNLWCPQSTQLHWKGRHSTSIRMNLSPAGNLLPYALHPTIYQQVFCPPLLEAMCEETSASIHRSISILYSCNCISPRIKTSVPCCPPRYTANKKHDTSTRTRGASNMLGLQTETFFVALRYFWSEETKGERWSKDAIATVLKQSHCKLMPLWT